MYRLIEFVCCNVADSELASGEVAGRQLFMISPKLLPDLEHGAAIRSEIVFNGTSLPSSAECMNTKSTTRSKAFVDAFSVNAAGTIDLMKYFTKFHKALPSITATA